MIPGVHKFSWNFDGPSSFFYRHEVFICNVCDYLLLENLLLDLSLLFSNTYSQSFHPFVFWHCSVISWFRCPLHFLVFNLCWFWYSVHLWRFGFSNHVVNFQELWMLLFLTIQFYFIDIMDTQISQRDYSYLFIYWPIYSINNLPQGVLLVFCSI